MKDYRQNSLIDVSPKVGPDGNFVSLTRKLREMHYGKGGNKVSLSDSIHKVYISIQCNHPTEKTPIPKPVIAFYIGREVCKDARFMIGDFIEVCYDKISKKFLLKRTNDRMAGYKLSYSGGNARNDRKSTPSTMLVKMKYDQSLFPKVDDLSELKNINVSEKGIIGEI